MQCGYPADSIDTAMRPCGYTQAVVIDDDGSGTSCNKINAPADLVTSLACYRVRFPGVEGVYPVTLELTDDIGDPPVETVVSEDGLSKTPCKFELTLNVHSTTSHYPTATYCPLSLSEPLDCDTGGGGPEYKTHVAAIRRPELDAQPPLECRYHRFIRGDANQDGFTDLTDVIVIKDWLFLGGATPGCRQAADSNRDGAVNVTDVIYLLQFLFLGTSPPPPPYPDCRQDLPNANDPAPGNLDCLTASPCATDEDGDGLSQECESAAGSLDSMANTDTDNDGLDDYAEILVHGSNPAIADSDGDGVDDGDEIASFSDPTSPDAFDEGSFVVEEPPTEYGPPATFLPCGWNCFGRNWDPVEVKGVVWHPVLGGSSDRFPLIMILHGQHAACVEDAGETCTTFTGEAANEWRCPEEGYCEKENHRGYDYFARTLASYGYIVVSIRANGINALGGSDPPDLPTLCTSCLDAMGNEVEDPGSPDGGIRARAELILHHLELWEGFDSGEGELGGTFQDRVDLQRIGLIGHSRGGEGVVEAFERNVLDLNNRFAIEAVALIAPTRESSPRPLVEKVPLLCLLPYCDGDVTALFCVQYFDAARYPSGGSEAPLHQVAVLGANHNFFSTIWTPGIFPPGSQDDWIRGGNSSPSGDWHCGVNSDRRLTRAEQRAVGTAYVSAFFLAYLRPSEKANDPADQQFAESWKPLLRGDAPPPAWSPSDVLVSYHAPDSARLDLNRFDDPAEIGSIVQGTGNVDFLSGSEQSLGKSQQPHTAEGDGLEHVKVEWTSSGTVYRNSFAAPQDVGGHFALQFRAGLNFASPKNTRGAPLDFTVRILDNGGRLALAPARFATVYSGWNLPEASASLSAGNVEPYDLQAIAGGQAVSLDVIVNSRSPVKVSFSPSDARIANFSQASAAEIAEVISDALEGGGASAMAEGGFVKIITDLEGIGASIQVLPGDANANAAFDFPLVSAVGSGPPDPLLYHPGRSTGLLPKNLLHTVRMPLECFQADPGFDWTQVESVDFVFDQTDKGSLLLADLSFVDDTEGPGPCP